MWYCDEGVNEKLLADTNGGCCGDLPQEDREVHQGERSPCAGVITCRFPHESETRGLTESMRFAMLG